MAPSRKRPAESDNEDEVESNASDGDDTSSANIDLLAKSLVRLAITSEYSRTPIRRADVTTHVFQPHQARPRLFRPVFDAAQLALRQTFGMELVELPAREKVTLAARRKEATAQAQQQSSSRRGPNRDGDDIEMSRTQAGDATPGPVRAQSKGQKSWVLVSVLAERYHSPETRLAPSKAPTEDSEATYAGLCTLVVSLIVLSGGTLAQGKLDRHLRRANAETNMPLDRTDKILARMMKEGYILRVKENIGGEELIEYYVGPRGKVEIGQKGVGGLVRMAFGGPGTESNAEAEAEMERRLERSLRVGGLGSGNTTDTTETRPRVETSANNDEDEDR